VKANDASTQPTSPENDSEGKTDLTEAEKEALMNKDGSILRIPPMIPRILQLRKVGRYLLKLGTIRYENQQGHRDRRRHTSNKMS